MEKSGQHQQLPPEEDDSSQASRVKGILRGCTGIVLTLISAACFAIAGDFMKLSTSSGFPSLQIIFLNRLCIFAFNLVPLLWLHPRVLGDDRRQTLMLILLALGKTTGTVLLLMSVVYIRPMQAHSIVRGLDPVLTAILALIFLKEALSAVDVTGGVICISGVTIVGVSVSQMANDTSSSHQALIQLLPVCCAIAMAITTVLGSALLRKEVHQVMLVFYVEGIGTPTLCIIMYIFVTPNWNIDAKTGLYIAAHIIPYGLGIYSLWGGLKLEKAAIVAALSIAVVPFSLLFDYVILSMIPSTLQTVGGVAVVVGSVIIAVNTYWVNSLELQRQELLAKLDFS